MEPLVLLHGFTGSPHSWDAVLAHLGNAPDRGTPHLVVELPGHAPGFIPQRGFEANVDAVEARIRERLQQPCHLVGYSLGARLALGLLARHPQWVARATLIGVNPGLTTASARDKRRRLDSRWIAMLRREGVVAFVDAWENLPLFSSQARLASGRLQWQRSIRLGHDAEQLAQSLEQMGLAEMPDYRDVLRRCRAPLRVIVGAADAAFCVLAKEIVALNPRCDLLTLDDCGHNPLLEAPAACATALRRRW